MNYNNQPNQDHDPKEELKLSDKELRMKAQSIRTVEKPGAVGKTAEKVGDMTLGTTARLLGCFQLPFAVISFGIIAAALERGNDSINIFGAGGLAFILAIVFYFLIGFVIQRIERRITLNNLSSY